MPFNGFVQNPNTFVQDATTGVTLAVNPDGSLNATFSPALSVPLGYQQIDVDGVVVGLTVPATSEYAIIQNAGSLSIRWRDDGVSPTGGGAAGEGMVLQPGAQFTYDGDLNAIEFIRNTGAATTELNISYYKYA